MRHTVLAALCLVLCIGSIWAQGEKRPGIVTDGLIAHFTFDEGAGDTVRDTVGGQVGKLVNAKFIPMPVGFALEFDGKSGYMQCEPNDIVNPPWDHTLEAWVISYGLPNNNKTPGIVGMTPWFYGFAIRNGILLSHLSEMGDGNLTSCRIERNKWHHIVVTFDTQMMKMYKDGALVMSKESKWEVVSEGPKFYVGRSVNTEGRWGGYFEGAVDQVRIYNRALTDEEVAQNYAATVGQVIEAPKTQE